MSSRLELVLEFIKREILEPFGRLLASLGGGGRALGASAFRWRRVLVASALVAAIGYLAYKYPPYVTGERGEIIVRSNAFDGSVNGARR